MGQGHYDGDDTIVKGNDGTDEGVKIDAVTDKDGIERLAVDAIIKQINDDDHVTTIDWEHEQIHEGKHFTYTDFFTLNNNKSQYYLFEVGSGDEVPHLAWGLNVQEEVEVYLYEAPSYTKGTALTARNNNRNYPDGLTNCGFFEASSVSGGTQLHKEFIPAKSNIPSGSKRETEQVLSISKNYVLQFKSKSNNNIISIEISGYCTEEGNGS